MGDGSAGCRGDGVGGRLHLGWGAAPGAEGAGEGGGGGGWGRGSAWGRGGGGGGMLHLGWLEPRV